MLILSFYPGAQGGRVFIFYVSAALLGCLFLITFSLRKRETLPSIVAAVAVAAFITIIAVFCVAALLHSESPYATRFLLYFYIFEIIIIFDPLSVIIVNTLIMAAFYVACKFFPPDNFGGLFGNWMFDFLNVTLTTIISTVLNWVTTYVNIKNWILTQSLTEERNHYREESVHDILTGLNNRRSFDQSVDFYISVCGHVHQTVCVVMMDVDYFKLYNDFYGHPKGDIVLQSVGNVLRRLIDEEHVYSARVGGEEFIMLWTENRTIECERIALKLRQLIIDLRIPHERSKVAPYVTASFGMYIMRGGTQSTAEELYRTADTALYKAKEWGRNRIVLFDSQDGSFRELDLRNYRSMKRD
jgi:diguanylate cyclase (GGDEF)-like protein